MYCQYFMEIGQGHVLVTVSTFTDTLHLPRSCLIWFYLEAVKDLMRGKFNVLENVRVKQWQIICPGHIFVIAKYENEPPDISSFQHLKDTLLHHLYAKVLSWFVELFT